MDVDKTIGQLREEKDRLDRAITRLEKQLAAEAARAPAVPKRRGRKSMSPQDRLEVSKRMRAYWAAHRKNRSA